MLHSGVETTSMYPEMPWHATCRGSFELCRSSLFELRVALDEFLGAPSGKAYRNAPIFIVAFDGHDGSDTVTDRKSTRLNSSHLGISYAVFCLKKKKTTTNTQSR